MNHSKLKELAGAVCLVAVIVLSGCHKKAVVAQTPPPPPPTPSPTANLAVAPEAINPGQSARLTWQTTNATETSISGVGTVSANGSQAVSPAGSTTYTLTAKGPGGSVEATARVTVNPPVARQAPLPPSMTEEQLFAQNVQDVYFDYDKSDLRPQASTKVEANAAFLKKYPDMKIVIGGHCDERGSAEYNVALGESRGNSLLKALVDDGIPTGRIRVVSYGKEQPFCTESNEQCWQQNRRDHLVLDR
jgi:peptidoglycan-associated lipoprotein